MRYRTKVARLTAIVAGGLLALTGATPAMATVTARSVPLAPTPTRWGRPLVIDAGSGAPDGISALSCPTASFCAAVDGSGRVLMFDGVRWSRPRSVDTDPTGLNSVSCATSRFCVATDTNGFDIVWRGSRWSAPHSIDPTGPAEELGMAVSCPTTTFCGAVDNLGTALVWRGHGWSRQRVKDRFGNAVGLSAVSCTGPSFCVAVSNAGQAVRWNGTKWAGLRTVDTLGDLLAVSCVSSKFCAAGGDGALVYNGKRWTPPDSISASAIASMSCTTPRDCFAGDDLGNVYRWTGRRWLRPIELSPDDSLNSISCPTPSFCSTVTSGGATVFYAAVPEVVTHSLPEGVVGKRYVARLRATGGVRPYTYRPLSRLPRGLRLSSVGVITGVPRATSHGTITVGVDNPLGEHTSHRVGLTIH